MVLRLTGVTVPGVGPVDLQVRAGEVLGLVGLTSAGHMDLGRALTGTRPLLDGEALLDGKPYRPGSVSSAVKAGVGFVTSNRQEEGCALELTVRENFLANPAARGGRRSVGSALAVNATKPRPWSSGSRSSPPTARRRSPPCPAATSRRS